MMQVKSIAFLMSLLALFLVGTIATQQSDDDADSLGIVYAYGVKLSPPYQFTGVGGDTLYLNDWPFAPKRRSGPDSVERAWRELPEAEREAVMKRSREDGEFERTVLDSVTAMRARGVPYEQCLEEYIRLYRTHPHVVSVTRIPTGIRIGYDSGTFEEQYQLTFERPTVPMSIDRTRFHGQVSARFWRTIRAGGMVAFGVAEDCSYELYAPCSQLKKTFEMFAKLTRGEELSAEDVLDTPLSIPAFLADMKQHLRQPVMREE